ncbi:MAG: hydrogenase expression/formation protein HypE [Anaerolineales bacterium]
MTTVREDAKGTNGRTGEQVNMDGAYCPVPLQPGEQVVLGHGSGGRLTQDLIARYFYPPFNNPVLLRADDAAVLEIPEGAQLAFSTDSHIVSPLFFPGGDIGRLAVSGTVNDLLMVGAHPLWLTAGFLLEEGLALETVERVAASMRAAADEAGVLIVAGDTKVVERGKADGLFINTSGVGAIPSGRSISGTGAKPGDAVLLSGTIGDHGIAVLAARGQLDFEAEVESDVAPLNEVVEAILEGGDAVHALRDPTRGGVATALNEISVQSNVGIEVEETSLPVKPAVEAACEMLGFDPLYVANEGKLIAIVDSGAADAILARMRATSYGRDSVRIGTVVASPAGRVLMKTAIGARRVIDVMAGEMLPRIC